jgi:acetate kinase
MGTTLVVNPGSSSKKYALYSCGKQAMAIRFEKTGSGFERSTQVSGGETQIEVISQDDFTNSLETVHALVDRYIFREHISHVNSVVVRVVAPGTCFQQHAEIDDVYLEKLNSKAKAAPIHIPIIIREINQVKKVFQKIKIIAASDSEFHKDLPVQARIYSVDTKDAEELDLYRFGYHGLSVSSIVNRIHSVIGIDPENLIVCHLGSGCSVTAVKKGKSVDTTMGFSPTSGLPMSSRAGDLDSSALLYLMTSKGWKPKEAELYLDTRGGLVGMSGATDIRTLLDMRAHQDKGADVALNTFAYHIRKAIAASTAALGGVDVIVLTATAGVRSSELRALILANLEYLGVVISKDRNDMMVSKDGIISVHNSKVKVVVMRTDEMGEMAAVATKFN